MVFVFYLGQDWGLFKICPAIKTYLGLGWEPWLFQEDMEPRWRKIAAELGRDFDSLNCLPADSSFPDKIS